MGKYLASPRSLLAKSHLWPTLGLEKQEDLTTGHTNEARIGAAHVQVGQTPKGLGQFFF
jgi:hypothetical protein